MTKESPISKAFSKNPGKLHKKLGVPQGEPIPATKLAKAANSSNVTLKREAVLAENAKHFNHDGPKKRPKAHNTGPKEAPSKFYSSEPVAPSNKIADKPLTPPPAEGAAPPAMVPKPPGRFDGMGGSPHHMGKPPLSGSHGFGHSAVQRQGHTRNSGHSGAHRIGKR